THRYKLIGEQLYLYTAGTAARSIQHFADPDTGMAVYYWNAIDHVSKVWKVFPWHAEWQVGWITDYLLAECRLRSNGKISFPTGFPTPKVGSQLAYGFKPGQIYGVEAQLWSGNAAVTSDNPDIEYVSAVRTDKKALLIVVLN